ncbi:hypothetical protein EVAR_102798_1 [Eumeta japonica]|uniref:Uncharacterized protein n=1 Tax=Eumeta variegata TaxID=151549 RepID=A0A4C1THW9_EUMVA|nr:hypothetical protein EVAR_102798_1 [Eumeta japonica]
MLMDTTTNVAVKISIDFFSAQATGLRFVTFSTGYTNSSPRTCVIGISTPQKNGYPPKCDRITRRGATTARRALRSSRSAAIAIAPIAQSAERPIS